MTHAEAKQEHRYRYEERLALLGIYGPPPTWAHNMAVLEADHHMHMLKKEPCEEMRELLKVRDSLL